jgi:hypothetical protein
LNDGIDQNCVNDAPVIAPITNRTINEDTSTGVNYTLTDVDNTLSCTNATHITYTSTNTTLLPVANITRGGTYPNCSLTVTPVANLHGASTINVIADDGDLNSAQSFVITVNSVNDAPASVNKTTIVPQNLVYAYTTGDFSVIDTNDVPANTLNRVRVSSLPSTGTLMVSGSPVSVGQYVTLANISSGAFTYTPPTNAV